MISNHDKARGIYQRIYVKDLEIDWEHEDGSELWPYFEEDDDEEDGDGDDLSAYYHCPCCGAKTDAEGRQRGVKITYPCGGVYRKTVDMDGQACWEGRCGDQQLKQLSLALEEA